MKTSAKHLLDKYGIYSLAILLLFVVASMEYSYTFAVELVLKIIAFCLSMLLPVLLSANLATFDLPRSGASEKLLRLDVAAIIFISVQVLLWVTNLHQVQLYILGVSIALFVLTFLIFLVIRKLS